MLCKTNPKRYSLIELAISKRVEELGFSVTKDMHADDFREVVQAINQLIESGITLKYAAMHIINTTDFTRDGSTVLILNI